MGIESLKFPKSYIQLPGLSFLNKSFNWLSYQQVKLHNIKDIEAQMNFGSFYLDRETYRIPKLGRMCPERPFNNFIVGVNGMCFNKP
jgi:hypothetical protein